jgi:hypothetical protein
MRGRLEKAVLFMWKPFFSRGTAPGPLPLFLKKSGKRHVKMPLCMEYRGIPK